MRKFFKKLFAPKIITLTFETWRRKVNEKAKIEGAKKVISLGLTVIDEKSGLQVKNLISKGYTHAIAATDENGNVIGDIEFCRLKADPEIKRLHGQQGCVVINC